MYSQVPIESVAVLAKEDLYAQEWLLTKYNNLICSVAKSYFIAGGTNEDIVQEARVGFVKAIENYRPGYNFVMFSKMVMRRQIYETIRHSNRNKYKPLNDAISMYDVEGIDTYEGSVEPEQVVLTAEEDKIFNRRLKVLLSDLEYQVALCMIQGMGINDIGEKLCRSYRSVDNTMQRIKHKMKRWYYEVV